MEIQELKEKYSLFQKKHSLPGFDDLNATFDIGKIERDSGNLLRDVRRIMVEKVAHYLRLMELMFNPSQASPIFLILLKEINSADKKILDELFSKFLGVELNSYKLDVLSSEKEEALFISKVYSEWNDNRELLLSLLAVLDRNWKGAAVKNHKSREYFN